MLWEIPESGSFEACTTSRSQNRLFDLLAAAEDCKKESFKECSSCDVKQMEYRSQKCKLRISVKCVIESPTKNHSLLKSRQESTQENIAEMEQMLEMTKEKILDYEADRDRDARKFKATETKINTAKKQIGKTFDDLVGGLRAREEGLIKHLDTLHKSYEQDHLIRKESVEMNLARMNNIVKYAEGILERSCSSSKLRTPLPTETQI